MSAQSQNNKGKGLAGRWIRRVCVAAISLFIVLSLANPNRVAPVGSQNGPRSLFGQNGQTAQSLTPNTMGITETTAQIMARQKDKDARGVVEPRLTKDAELQDDVDLLVGPSGLEAASSGFIPNALSRAPDASPAQTLGLNFHTDQFNNLVPPDTQGALGPTQFISTTNYKVRVFDKTTGAIGPLDVTLNSFFASVNGGGSTFDVIARYDRLTQRFFVTAEDGLTPNHIFVAVSGAATITAITPWTFHSFVTSAVVPVGSATCFADYPTTAVDAHALIIGVNNFCPTSYANSDVFVVDKTSAMGLGSLGVNVFRNVGVFTPRGVDSWDPDPSGTQASYFISAYSTTQMAIRPITYPLSVPTLGAFKYVTIPTIATPIPLEHLGNLHPGGTFNGQVDGNDARFLPSVIRNGVLWAGQGSLVNSTGVTTSGDRDAMRWYQVSSLDTTPVLTQSGTIFDSAATNPKSYTYGSLMVSGQGHTAFGFSIISAATYNSGGYTGRLVNDAAGFTAAPQVIVTGAGAYNAFDTGTGAAVRPQRWGDYSQVMLDPCDDMTLWTAQEYTGVASTGTSHNSYWGTHAAALLAPPPAALASANPVAVTMGQASVNVIITGTSSNGSGFYDTPSSMSIEPCRKRLSAAVSGGVTVNSVTYTDPTHVTLNLSTTSASAGLQTVTLTNPDGQFTAAAILQVNLPPKPSNIVLASGANPSVFGQSVMFTATVSGSGGTPTGSVTFFDNGTPLGTTALAGGVATFSTSALSAGNHSQMTASYGGDSAFAPSVSTPISQVVDPAATSTGLGALPNPSVSGQPVVFTATVSATAPGAGTATGSVIFYDNASALGTVSLSAGVANLSVSSFAVGTHNNLTAVYAGSSNFTTSTSSPISQVVNQASSSTSLGASPNPASYGQAVLLTATVSPVNPSTGAATGSVTFYDHGLLLGSGPLAGGVATYSASGLAIGVHSALTAVYSGDTSFNPSTSSPLSLTIIGYNIFTPITFK